MDFDEIFSSPAFYILAAIGYGAFFMMLFILKGMGDSSIMPLWEKIVTIIAIPIVAAVFASFGD